MKEDIKLIGFAVGIGLLVGLFCASCTSFHVEKGGSAVMITGAQSQGTNGPAPGGSQIVRVNTESKSQDSTSSMPGGWRRVAIISGLTLIALVALYFMFSHDRIAIVGRTAVKAAETAIIG